MIVALEGVPVTSGPPIHDLLDSLDKQTQQVALVRSASTDEVNAKVTLGSPGWSPEYDHIYPIFFYLRARGGVDSSQAISDITKVIELAAEIMARHSQA